MTAPGERPISRKAEAAVHRLLKDRLSSIGYERVELSPDEGNYGDPIIRVKIVYRRSDEPISIEPAIGLTTAVRQALDDAGEDRFPIIQHMFDENQRVSA